MKPFDEYWYAPEQAELRKSCAMGWAMRVWNASRDATLSDPVAYAVFASNGNIRIWCADPVQVETLRQQYGEALQPLYAHPQPADQQPDVDDFVATFRCESNGVVGTTTAKIHSVTRHDDGVIEVVIDHWPQQGQPAAPDVSELVGALESIQKAATRENVRTGIRAATVLGYISSICDITLADYREQGGGE